MTESGVLSSWEMIDRKLALAWLARTRSWFAASRRRLESSSATLVLWTCSRDSCRSRVRASTLCSSVAFRSWRLRFAVLQLGAFLANLPVAGLQVFGHQVETGGEQADLVAARGHRQPEGEIVSDHRLGAAQQRGEQAVRRPEQVGEGQDEERPTTPTETSIDCSDRFRSRWF